MNTDTFSVRLDRATKAKLEKLAKSTGRSRAYLAATAIEEYLDINDFSFSHSSVGLSRSFYERRGNVDSGTPTILPTNRRRVRERLGRAG